MTAMRFANRRDAGRLLSRELRALPWKNPVILALPRGGVPVAFEVANALGAPLDVLMVRKIGAPGNEEYGIGAVVDGGAHQVLIDEERARLMGASRAYIDAQVVRQLAEIERRRALYGAEPIASLENRDVIVVDDGIATGGTVRAALLGLARAKPARIVLAVPVAPAEVLAELQPLCDRLICLSSPAPFRAVGAHYGDFTQTEDTEVMRFLALSKLWRTYPSRPGKSH
jgi:putative phosphoribosyl transferase